MWHAIQLVKLVQRGIRCLQAARRCGDAALQREASPVGFDERFACFSDRCLRTGSGNVANSGFS